MIEKTGTYTSIPQGLISKKPGNFTRRINAGEEKGALGINRRKLLEFLKNSTYYTPTLLLKKFPSNSLLEERCLLLSRVPRHEEALQIYAYQLKDFKAAE